jgi:four helix bundle protein
MTANAAFKELDTWQQAMFLVQEIYKSTAKFPGAELYGLTSQLRRAAVSVPSNVAEGYCRRSTKAYAYHVSIALGSHAEVETCIELAARLGFLSPDELARYEERTSSVGRLLSGLHRSLEEKLAAEEARSGTKRERPT